MRARALACTVAHARQERSGLAAAHRTARLMPTSARTATVARAVAHAFLAGEWEPSAMARRGRRTLGTRAKWLVELAQIVRAGFPERPADRPGEVATFIAATDVFQKALGNRRGRVEVRRWMPAPTEMGGSRWAVPPLADLRALGVWLGLDPGEVAWFADVRSLERRGADEKLRHYH